MGFFWTDETTVVSMSLDRQVLSSPLPTMNINIVNFGDGDRVSHRLALLKGRVEGEDQGDCTGKFKVFIRRPNSDHVFHKEYIPIKCAGPSFTAVLDLSVGRNMIHFEADRRITTRFTLVYAPPESDYVLRPLFICQPGGTERLAAQLATLAPRVNLGLALIQAVFSEKLFESGCERRTFIVDMPASIEDGILEVALSPADRLRQHQTWETIGKELAKSAIYSPKTKFLAFLFDNSTTDKAPALGVGALALVDSEFIKDWPKDPNDILEYLDEERNDVMDGTNPFSKSIGSVVHELGHVFDLPHSEKGIMGREYHVLVRTVAPIKSYKKRPSRNNKIFSYSKSAPRTNCHDEYLRPVVLMRNEQATEDQFTFNISSSLILFYNRWFVPMCENKDDNSVAGPTFTKNSVICKGGLVVVELQDLDSGLTFRSWTFEFCSKPSYEFTLKRSDFVRTDGGGKTICERALLFVIDKNGACLKTEIEPGKIAETFTFIRRYY